MEIRTLDEASGWGKYAGQQYYVDDAGQFAGLVPANQPTTPANNVSANQAPTFSTPGAADYNPYTNPNATEEEKIKFRQDNFTYSPTNEPEVKPAHIPDDYVYDPSKGGYVAPGVLGNVQTSGTGGAIDYPGGSDNNVPVNLVQETDSFGNPGFSTGSSKAIEETGFTLTPIQQAAQALQQKIEDVGISTFSRRSDDDRAIKFADDTNLLDKNILAQYGVSKKEFLDAIDDLGADRGSFFRTSRGGSTDAFQTGLENILLSPEERILAEQEYAEGLEAKRLAEYKKKKKRDRDKRIRATLDAQAKKDASALGISTDDYYNLPFIERLKMAGADIAELFDPSQGSLMGSETEQSGRALGTLGAENKQKFSQSAKKYIEDQGGPIRPYFESTLENYNLDPISEPIDYSGGGFTIPGTSITITAPENGGGVSGGGGDQYGGGGGGGDQYGYRPKYGAFANISGGGGGGIWDRFRGSYLTRHGLEGESPEMENLKVSYDPESGVYFYPDGTPVDPADLAGLDISDTFQEQTGTERYKL